MNPSQLRYRIYISDDGRKHYLRDWIICDAFNNLIFDVDRNRAMKFKSWDAVMKYRDKMIGLDYHPHIESI